jgi:hypothetical protein
MPVWLLNFLGGPIVQKLLDFIPDPAERARQQFALQQAAIEEANKAEADQRDINKVEAGSASMFVAGWRPAVGWLCVFTLAWSWVAAPLASWVIVLVSPGAPPLPTLGSADSQTLLYALLGLGSLRTVDKATGGATTGIVGRLLNRGAAK